MASLHKNPRGKSPFWYAAYTTASGRRAFKSTKRTVYREALEIALNLERAEREASSGRLNEAHQLAAHLLRYVGIGQFGVVCVPDRVEAALGQSTRRFTFDFLQHLRFHFHRVHIRLFHEFLKLRGEPIATPGFLLGQGGAEKPVGIVITSEGEEVLL